jgi:hypothetical protein
VVFFFEEFWVMALPVSNAWFGGTIFINADSLVDDVVLLSILDDLLFGQYWI